MAIKNFAFDIDPEFVNQITSYWVTPGFSYMAAEELGELQHALFKVERHMSRTGEGAEYEEQDHQALVDEIGDVLISIAGIADMFEISDAEIQARIYEKMRRHYN